MLYMVECRFTDPAREDAWNEWYSGERLGELLSVPGFRTSQRFKAVTRPPTYYLTVHSIDSLAVFRSAQYKAIGGGAFAGYQAYITDWKRGFFEGIDLAPAVALDEYLAVTDAPAEKAQASGIGFTWLKLVEPARSAAPRGIARLDADGARRVMGGRRFPVDLYAPMILRRLGTARSC